MLVGKRSQITVFIVIGIILIISIGLFIFLNNSKSDIVENQIEEAYEDVDVNSLRMHIEKCIEQTGKDAIYYVSLQGGYYDLPYHSFYSYDGYAPYYYIHNASFFPTKKFIENEISYYMDEDLVYCAREYNITEIIVSDSETETTITKDNVLFKVDMPIEIKIGDESKIISEFVGSYDKIPLDTVLEISKRITDTNIQNISNLCISCLIDITAEYGWNISVHIEDENILFSIYNNEYYYEIPEVTGEDEILGLYYGLYEFMFAGYYFPISEEDETALETGLISSIPDQTVSTTKEFRYKIETLKPGISFLSFSDLVAVDDSGWVTALPENEDVGNHTVLIRAVDQNGEVQHEEFILTVEELV